MSENDFTKGEFQGMVLNKLNNIENWMKSVEAKKVDKTEFAPVKSIVYGLAGIIMLTVVGAILAQVVKAFELLVR